MDQKLYQKNIAILLSTYNGELYLQEFLDSLSSQSCMDWFLIIRDDGSTDDTVKIIKRFISERDDCHYIEDDLRLGVVQSFSKLLQFAKKTNFNYFMFADQDDVWLHHKIELSFSAMKKMEEEVGSSVPVLVHTDLKVVDKKLDVISDSLADYQNIPKKSLRLRELVFLNNVTGCTLMVNQALAQLIKKIPKAAIMHDHWIALVASTMGAIVFVDNATILYRQHGLNDTGAKKWSLSYIFSRLVCLKLIKFQIYKKIQQYKNFYEEFHHLSPDFIPAFPEHGNFLAKRKWLIKHKFLHGKLIRRLALLILI